VVGVMGAWMKKGGPSCEVPARFGVPRLRLVQPSSAQRKPAM
jgi:hypothetical protein